jgi:hypothetical protein
MCLPEEAYQFRLSFLSIFSSPIQWIEGACEVIDLNIIYSHHEPPSSFHEPKAIGKVLGKHKFHWPPGENRATKK